MRYPAKIVQSYKLGLISRAVFVELWRQWQTVEIARQAIERKGKNHQKTHKKLLTK